MNIEINEAVATKVRDTVRQGLSMGLGVQEPGKMCVEAAVCFALGLPHGDEPVCVSPALRAFKIRLNDSAWSSEAARAKGLERLALAQLGTNKDFDDLDFAKRVAAESAAWAAWAAKSAAKSAESAWAAESAAWAAWAAKSAAWAAESAAKSAESAWAAESAAWAAESAAESAKWAYDKTLAQCAEDVVQILIEMNAPGCKWLYLTEQPK